MNRPRSLTEKTAASETAARYSRFSMESVSRRVGLSITLSFEHLLDCLEDVLWSPLYSAICPSLERLGINYLFRIRLVRRACITRAFVQEQGIRLDRHGGDCRHAIVVLNENSFCITHHAVLSSS